MHSYTLKHIATFYVQYVTTVRISRNYQARTLIYDIHMHCVDKVSICI